MVLGTGCGIAVVFFSYTKPGCLQLISASRVLLPGGIRVVAGACILFQPLFMSLIQHKYGVLATSHHFLHRLLPALDFR